MYQIDVPSAVGSLPTPAAAGTAGFFTDGNPGSGLPATIVPADFLNMLMQELINVVNKGGIPLDKTSYTQVRDAISNMIAAGGGGGGSGTVTAVTGIAPINSSGGVAPAISISAASDSAAGSMSAADKTKLDGIAAGATANAGTVTAVTVVSANGVSATVANQGTTPALTVSLGAITPSSVSSSGSVSGTTGTFSNNVSIAGTFTGHAVNGTTGTFSGAVSTGALTCTTFNATSSDRRLKRNIRKVAPRPLHRAIPFVAYDLKMDGSHGCGAIAQTVQKFAPDYVHQFKVGRATRLSIDKQSMAYEQAIWSGLEVDRLTLRIAKLERALAKAKIEPRNRGLARRLLEAIW